LKIATYNVNSIRSRLHIVLPWLEKNKPDYFCLQETKVADDKFPVAEFAVQDYHVIYQGNKQYSGVAIASRNKLQKVSFGLDDQPADPERLIVATYDDLTIINTYVPQGQDKESPQYAYKLAWFGRLKKYLQKHLISQNSIIWCGDLNVAPENIDVHDPKRILGHVCFNPDVWQAYNEVKSWGFVDLTIGCGILLNVKWAGALTIFWPLNRWPAVLKVVILIWHRGLGKNHPIT
jgi:exodeoxyribonuclease-3